MTVERSPRERRLRAHATDARARADELATRYVERTAVEREGDLIRRMADARLDRLRREVVERVVGTDAAAVLDDFAKLVIEVRRGFAADLRAGLSGPKR